VRLRHGPTRVHRQRDRQLQRRASCRRGVERLYVARPITAWATRLFRASNRERGDRDYG